MSKLKAEVERLKAEAQAKMSGKFYVMSDAEVVTIEGLQAEVKRLTGERDALRSEAFALGQELDRQRTEKRAWNIDANNLKAENAKLREALQAAVDALEGWWCDATGNRRHSDDARALQMAAALGVKVTS